MIFNSEKGGLSTKMLIILGVVFFLLVGGGIFAYIMLSSPEAHSKPQPETQSLDPEKATDLPGPIFSLDTFIVNLLDDSGRRYLKTSINLELNEKLVEEEIKQKMPLIQDTIIVLLSSKSYDDVADISGKLRLRTQIINRLNSILTVGKVNKVYFTDFVIQ